MTASDSSEHDVPLSHLEPEEKAARSGSFGGVASDYERYRPGPPGKAVDWFLPERVRRVVDLGAGTGALTRLLLDKADEVVAVEPDERMRSVLVDAVPWAIVVDGRGEEMPLPDRSADAVLAASSWHWMDLLPTLREVARVLVPGGILGAVWAGPDPDGAFLAGAWALLAGGGGGSPSDGAGSGSSGSGLASFMKEDGSRPVSTLEVPPEVPFSQPDHEVFRWDVALDVDDLIGLLGTFSWVINLEVDARRGLFDEARRLLGDIGVEGEVTVDVTFRADAWRSRAQG